MLDLDHLREIADALGANRVRTLLTAFGVFWGVFMLVALLGSGNGLKNGVIGEFAGSATNSFFVWTQRTSKPYRGLSPGRVVQMTNEDTEAILRQVPDARMVAPRVQLGGYNGGNNVTRKTKSGGFGVLGDVPGALSIERYQIVAGRFLDPLDLAERRKVAVIGSRVREVLFDKNEDPLGQDIRIQGIFFRVVGVFRPLPSGEDTETDSQKVHVPFTTFQKTFGNGHKVGWFAITSKDDVKASQVEDQVLALLKARHQVAPDDARAFGHYNVQQQFERLQGLFGGIRLLIWIVGVGTLSAGVIGVSNIMLVIVKERTREIGIRRAVGATPLWISTQIVLEALLLTSVAGYAGLLAGVGSLDLVRAAIARTGAAPAMFVNPDVSLASVVLALAVVVVSGVLAGLLPAQRAIAIRTVEALRAE